MIESLTNVVPYTYLDLAGLTYVIVIIIAYYKKNKVRTLENICYSSLLVFTAIFLTFEVIRIILPVYINSARDYIVLNKLYLISMAFWMASFMMYILAWTSRRRQGFIDFKENKHRKYFTNWKWVLYGLALAVSIVILFLHIEVNPKNYLFLIGRALNVVNWFVIVFIEFCVFCVLYKTDNDNKLFLMFILGMFALAYLLELRGNAVVFPAGVAYSIVALYFVMENPDIKLIEDLNNAKQMANDANAAKTDFLGSMSREIRTPLNSIIGLSQNLMEEDISDSAKEEMNDIVMASESLIEIVNGILDISKVEENKIEIKMNEYSFTKLTKEVISLSKSRLNSSNKPIEFEYEIDPNVPPVLYGDAGKIKEVMINFLTNAIKYTEKGKIKFIVTSNIKGDMCYLDMSISDTGIGIKKENIDKLFTRFQRFDLEKNSAIEGTGLGLSITKKMVEEMGGEIKVDSVYGQGSTFTASIAQKIISKNDTEMEEEVSSSTTPFDASGQTVFVVEDNKNNAIVAERFLKKYKVNVVHMENPNECIEKIKNYERCNLVLLDENLTGDKSEIVSQIKAADKSMPVVAYTANAIAGMREKYLDAGYDEYLSQPIDRSELRRIMSLFLKMKEMFSGKKEEAAPAVAQTQVEPTQMVSSTQAVAPAPMPEPVQPAVAPAEMPTPVVEPTVAPAPMPEPVTPTVAETAPVEVAPVAEQPASVVTAPVETVPAVEPAPVEAASVEATPEVEVTAAPVEPVAAVEETVAPAEPVAAAPSSDVPASHTAEYLSSEGADMTKAMELLGDMETYDMAAEEFNNSYEESMGKIKSTKEAADWANYAIETHALKSNARYLGFEGLGDIAYEHELAGKEPNPDKINEGYDKLIAEYERVYNVLKKYLES